MRKATILILDPEAHNQWVLKTILESEGYHVITVSTLEGALKSISKSKLSGLITEYWISHSSTLEAIREFKKSFPDAYVMMLANGEVQESEYQQLLEAGVDDFFSKPFSTQKVLLHLRKGLNHHQNRRKEKGTDEEFSMNFRGNELR